MELTKTKLIRKEITSFIFITLGAIITAIGLELFLVPNNILDGGITGISIILSELFGTKLSIFILLLNLPFIFIGYKRIGPRFTLRMLYGIVLLSISTSFLHHFEPATDDMFLATIFGAVILGAGVGTVLRYGAALDGTEIIAILISKKRPVSVGQVIMIMNLFIYIAAALLVFSWESAMYSIVSYFIASKIMDIIIEGVDEMKTVTIISDHSEEIANTLIKDLGRGITFINGEGVYSKKPKKIIYTIVSRVEISMVRDITHEIDPRALISIQNVADFAGSNLKKQSSH